MRPTRSITLCAAASRSARAIVAGVSVAFIAIIADCLIAAGAARTRRRLGLN